MKKNPIGFETGAEINTIRAVPVTPQPETIAPRKSLVQVFFPSHDRTLTYYNDRFDLKPGDLVFVEGKLEGEQGRVTEVNYSFKIKLSDYMRIIAVANTSVKGEFYPTGSHFVTFDKTALSYEQVSGWFKAPDSDSEYVHSNDDSKHFPLDDLGKMHITPEVAARGKDYYMCDRVVCLCVDGIHGRAIVEGRKYYEVEFDFCDGEISNLMCSCYCGYGCKHEIAVMLQLREILEYIEKHFIHIHDGFFTAISRNMFINIAMDGSKPVKIRIGD